MAVLSLAGALVAIVCLYRLFCLLFTRRRGPTLDAPWRVFDPRALAATALAVACPLFWYHVGSADERRARTRGRARGARLPGAGLVASAADQRGRSPAGAGSRRRVGSHDRARLASRGLRDRVSIAERHAHGAVLLLGC